MMQTGNLRAAKLRLMNDPELSELLVRSGWSEIMFDLNDDLAPDVCFSDENNDGDIDTISIDLTGNGEFNLFLHDADGNGLPDTIFYAEDGSDQLEILATGSEVETRLKEITLRLYDLLIAEEFLNEEMGFSLNELSDFLKDDLEALLMEVQKITNPEELPDAPEEGSADVPEEKLTDAPEEESSDAPEEELSDIEKVCRFLEEAEVYYLATAEGDQPRVRPFGTILLYEGKLYIQTGKVKDVSRQLAANPKAEICAFLDGIWLRLSGELINDDRIEVKKAMLEKYPSLQAMYSAEDDNTQVLYFDKAVAVVSSFTEAPEVIRL